MTKKYREGIGLGRVESGVTLLETMITVAIAAVLLALGIPSFIEFTCDARRDSRVGNIVVSLNYARAEAVKRGHQVSLCPSSDGLNCNGDKRWETGWIVFTDPNSNGAVDDGEAILRVSGKLDGEGTLRGAKTRMTYQSTGFSPFSNDTLRVCDQRGTGKGRRVIVNNTGRVRVASNPATCP